LEWLVDFGTGDYFLAQFTNGELTIRKATFSSNGFGDPRGQVYSIPGLGVLTNDPASGMTLVRLGNDEVRIDDVGEQIAPEIRSLSWIPEVGLFIDIGSTTLLAKIGKDSIGVELAARGESDKPQLAYRLPDGSGI
jgi:hypothetical protein